MPTSRTIGIKATASEYPINEYSPLGANSLISVRQRLIETSNIYQQMASANEFCDKYVIPQKLSSIRAELWNRGFRITHTHPTIKKAYQDFAKKIKLEELCLDGFNHLSRMNNACLLWRETSGRNGIEWVMFYNPAQTEIDILGNKIWVTPDADFQKAILEATESQLNKYKSRYGKESSANKWVDYIKNKVSLSQDEAKYRGKIPIQEQDNEHFILIAGSGGDATRQMKYATCLMQSIFVDLELLQLLIDGDWATAFLLKNTFMLVKAGESISTGPLAGSQKNWAKPSDLKALKTEIQKTGKAQIIYGNHTITIEFITPDPKMFASLKYDAVIDRVCWFFGIGKYAVIGSGNGGSYSSATWNMANIRTEAKSKRGIMKSHLTDFLTHPTVVREVLKNHYPIYCHNCFSDVNDYSAKVSPIIKEMVNNMGEIEYSNDGWNKVITIPIKDILPDIRTIVMGVPAPVDAKPEQFRLKLNARQAINVLGEPTISFDERILRDDKQVYTEILGLLKQGNLDNTTALEELGYSYETSIANKQIDWTNRKNLIPVFEASNGLLQNITEGLEDLINEAVMAQGQGGENGVGGRPSTRDETAIDTNDQQRPSTS